MRLRQMSKLRTLIWPALFLAAGIFCLFKTNTLLWMAFFMLSAFSFAVNVRGFGKRKDEGKLGLEDFRGPYGILGNYIVDATDSYGLFIRLLNYPVFIDIRQ